MRPAGRRGAGAGAGAGRRREGLVLNVVVLLGETGFGEFGGGKRGRGKGGLRLERRRRGDVARKEGLEETEVVGRLRRRRACFAGGGLVRRDVRDGGRGGVVARVLDPWEKLGVECKGQLVASDDWVSSLL